MTRLLVSLTLLTLVYALTLASFHPWDLLGGLVIAGALLLLFRRFLFAERPEPMPGLLPRALAFVPFLGAVILAVVADTWRVMVVTLRLRPLVRSGIVSVPIGRRTRNGVVVTALVTTLSPGSVFIDVDWEQGVMFFHVLDATHPDEVRAMMARFYDRYQRGVFP